MKNKFLFNDIIFCAVVKILGFFKAVWSFVMYALAF